MTRSPLNLIFLTCAPEPSPAPLPGSGQAPAPQCLSCNEKLKTEHRIWGATSPVPGTRGQSLSLFCWPHYFSYKPGLHWKVLLWLFVLMHLMFSWYIFYWVKKKIKLLCLQREWWGKWMLNLKLISHLCRLLYWWIK